MDKILDIKIDNLTQTEIRQKVESFLVEDSFCQIATVNPEFILEAQKNSEFRNILNSCDLNVADGFGIQLAFWRYGKKLKYRMAGADLMDEILKIANEKRLSIFLAVNKSGLSNFVEIKSALQKLYPNLEISGENLDINDTSYIIPATNIIFCNFGAPRQEAFLRSQKNGKIRLAMGVGGSFDYLTGKAPRAPQFLRQIGLEWFWRLILQPKRWKRILKAVFAFSLKVIFCKEK